MEKEKLLRSLNLKIFIHKLVFAGMLLALTPSVYAKEALNNAQIDALLDRSSVGNEQEIQEWASKLSDESKNLAWKELERQYEELLGNKQMGNLAENDIEENIRPERLYIFVSASMPIGLLQSYYKMAERYKAILVFKGLPKGSFKELTKLILEIASTDKNLQNNQEQNLELAAGMQIDDEAFARYGINSAPAFVLARAPEFNPNQEGQEDKIIYDKIVGNVGLKYALEQFAKSGDLKIAALEYLNSGKENAK
jgi:type-F conjugative transfer system pilin assembly protein TrbC